jgi:ABC-type transport system involved in multi-copper enzyme maturation permease subunit
MFWLTLRQHRPQALLTMGFLVVFGVALLVHGMSADGLTGAALDNKFRPMFEVVDWMPLLPVLFGAFWGAPVLAREFEQGTHKLAWSQSVTRLRWLAVKLGGLGLIVALAGLAFGFMVKAWLNAFGGSDLASSFAQSGLFSTSGVVPAAWWLFAFMLGAAAGALTRRMLPAIAIAIAVSVLVMVGVFTSRESYATPEKFDSSGMSQPETRAKLSGYLIAGQEADGTTMDIYPPTRYWQFQWTEAGILFAGTLLLGGVTAFGALRRRV